MDNKPIIATKMIETILELYDGFFDIGWAEDFGKKEGKGDAVT